MTSDIVILKLLGSDELVKVLVCASGNSRGARYWTDCKPDMPMYKPPVALMKIGAGGDREYFWPEDCEEVGRIGHFESKKGRWDEVEFADAATEADMMYALAWGLADTPKKEKRLRIDLWHVGNDHIRGGKKQELPQIHLDNLKVLLSLFSDEKPIDRLMKAEAFRELGMFDQALKTLEFEFDEDFQITRDAIKELAMTGSVQVTELK
jgi:hypothetical protein